MKRACKLLTAGFAMILIVGLNIIAFAEESAPDVSDILDELTTELELTDEQVPQVEALEPVMGTAMRDILGTVFEYGDKKMNTRTKIKLAKKLKKISAEMNAGMKEILTPEQWQKYEAMKEAQKS
jgi:hypothetical protein